MKILVYTSNTGMFDNVRPPVFHDPFVPYFYFTDWPVYCVPWIPQPCPTFCSSRSRNSRIPKILPHLLMDCDFSIYHDANFTLKVSPSEIIEQHLGDADLAFMRHPGRNSALAEAVQCETLKLVGPEAMAQAMKYRERGLGDGLWCGGALIARRHNATVERFNEVWWREYINGCSRDQIALPWALKESGVKLNTIEQNYSDCPLLDRHYHVSAWPERDDNPCFTAARNVEVERESRLRKLCNGSGA
jgi:hypothetical protein